MSIHYLFQTIVLNFCLYKRFEDLCLKLEKRYNQILNIEILYTEFGL